MSVKFVAVVDAHNAPVYFRSASNTPEEVAVNHQFISEMSLDFVEQQSARIQANISVPLLALVHDGVAVYAMLSNTRTKYLVGIDALREPQNLEALMSSFQDAYVGFLCNPFRGSTTKMIESPQFDKKIDDLMSSTKPPVAASGAGTQPSGEDALEPDVRTAAST